jgi:hypothetical protein
MWYKFAELESNEDWLLRHKIIKEGDYYVFFHGSRATFDKLNGGSLLEDTPNRAMDFGSTNYFADKRLKLHIYKVLVKPEDIVTGFWAKTARDLDVREIGKKEQEYYNNLYSVN